uniref:Uncharacterized protein n=1 Tax=Nai virus TaxID=2081617 RepID=A0A2L1CCZ3_9VIRU|nr:hypothetical protein [Nai virus]
MEHTLTTTKAKEISAYVRSKYGEKSLGIVRLLSSVPYFRQAVFRGTLPGLLGMSLISFEKYLREEHGIIYRYDGSTFSVERVVGGATRRLAAYADDRFFSVGGAVVESLRSLYPDGDAFSSVPLVSLGRGSSVDNMFDHVDLPALCDYITKLPESYVDNTIIDDILKYRTLVEGEDQTQLTAVAKYRAVDAIHRLYVILRRRPTIVTELRELPACTDAEFMQVVMGVKRLSVMPGAGGKIPATLMTALKETWTDGEERNGAFILKGDVALDPFTYIGSSVVDLTLPDFEAPLVERATNQPSCSTQPAARAATASSPVGLVPDSFDNAIDLVLQYVDTNINDLSPDEKEIALYGFIGGEALFRKMSVAAQKNLTKTLAVGDHDATLVVAKLATAIRQNLKHRTTVTDEQASLMAGGRIVAWKGNWLIEPSGIWRKIK